MRLILLGAPGVGKGTQGMKLAEFFSIPKLSTGEILRKEIAAKTKLGLRIADILEKGLLVSDEVVEEIVATKLNNEYSGGFILDGFPRTFHQAVALDEILAKLPEDETFIININMNTDSLTKRIINRIMCTDCGYIFAIDNNDLLSIKCLKCNSSNCYQREDDNKETVIKRLEVYNELTRPMINYYRQKYGWVEVNADDTIDEVFNDIIVAIKNKLV